MRPVWSDRLALDTNTKHALLSMVAVNALAWLLQYHCKPIDHVLVRSCT